MHILHVCSIHINIAVLNTILMLHMVVHYMNLKEINQNTDLFNFLHTISEKQRKQDCVKTNIKKKKFRSISVISDLFDLFYRRGTIRLPSMRLPVCPAQNLR